jgi:hypothetical protein
MNVLDLVLASENDAKEILNVERVIAEIVPDDCSYIGISTNESWDSSNDLWWQATSKFLMEKSNDFDPETVPGFEAPHDPAMFILSNFKHNTNYLCGQFDQLRVSNSAFLGLGVEDAPNDVVNVCCDGYSDAEIELTWFTKSGEKCEVTPMRLKAGLEGPAFSSSSETVDRARCPIPVLSKMVR